MARVARRIALALVLGYAPAGLAAAPEPSPSPMPFPATEYVEVTATKIPQDPHAVPASVTVVDGDEIRAQGATDLRSALLVVGGIDIAPGGDAGPASFVPEMWGLREFDAFLLVVDGVPWGGAFNPDLPTLSILDVERIEVQRGGAPVMFGATSFVGVIQVIRKAPGSGGGVAGAAIGDRDSGGAAVATDLPSWGGFRSRIAVEATKRGYADPRTNVRQGHLLWRNLREVGAGGSLRLDLDLSALDENPGSPAPRVGDSLSPDVPLDANHNMLGSYLKPFRSTLTAGYAAPVGGGKLDATVSLTHREEKDVRGFLTDVGNTDPNANGFRETVGQTEAYLDAHWSRAAAHALDVVVGADYLYGKAFARGGDFDYFVPLDGSAPPDAALLPSQADVQISNHRGFAGVYGLVAWTASPRWRVDAGLRYNHTDESRGTSSVEFTSGAVDGGSDTKTYDRLSGSLGATFTAWASGSDDFRIFAAYRNTFKPAAVDFGLDSAPEILKPETAESWELGFKTRVAGGRVDIRLSGFQMDMDNLVVSQDTGGGIPGLVNAGSQRFRGADLEVEARLHRNLMGRLGYGLHDSRFVDYVQDFGGVPTQLGGNRLEMVPRNLASLGFLWAPPKGLHAHAEAQYVDPRYLNKRNTALAPSYTTWSAGIGWRFGAWDVRLDGVNLSDARDPVAESEMGDAQYYRLPARTALLTARWSF